MRTLTVSAETWTLLQRLADLHGIDTGYHDVFGTWHDATETALRKVLAQLGVEAATHADGLQRQITEAEEVVWRRVIEPVVVRKETEPRLTVDLNLPADRPTLRWSLYTEEGQVHEGEWSVQALEQLEQRTLSDGQQRLRVRADLSSITPPLGYHRLVVRLEGQPDGVCKLIRVPEKAYLPEPLRGDAGTWGPAVQLYSIRSGRNMGMGDTTDLKWLVQWFASEGAGMVGLNPMHELFPHNPHHISPYSPSSRQFYNTLYVDVTAIPEFSDTEKAQLYLEMGDIRQALDALRQREQVDYPWVASIKRRVMELCFETFRDMHLQYNTPRAQAFQRFVDERGIALHNFAVYQALQEHFFQQDQALWGWPVWDAAYQNPGSAEVEAFTRQNAQRIRYFQYLQFVMEEQLAEVQRTARQLGMPVGLYMDVAVGANLSGADLWLDRAQYCQGASVGAPPDAFNQLGQNWGLPPVHPQRLRDAGYEPFIRTVQANTRYAGALRIDHALALFRAYWVPEGENGQNGAYVRYNAREMMGILALESHRNQCVIIGEDLGTIPQFVYDGLAEFGLLSYKVFFFEQHSDTEMKKPEEYPWLSLVTVSTHDLPTLAGFWDAEDIRLRQSLHLFPTEEQHQAEWAVRPTKRRAVVDALKAQGFAGHEFAPRTDNEHPGELPKEIQLGVHQFLARTPARLQAVQLEDLLLVKEQMNMPGTIDEHPNWRRRIPVALEDFETQQRLMDTLYAIRSEQRRQVGPRPPMPV